MREQPVRTGAEVARTQERPAPSVGAVIAFVALVALYATSFAHYALFHSLTEIFSIVVAAGIFAVAWNSRRIASNNYLLFIGIAYLYVGVIDLFHTLTFRGMGLFPQADDNLPTQFWIAARYLEALTLMIAPFFLERRVSADRVLAAYTVVTGLLLWAIFRGGIFPDCYLDSEGLTPFKIVSEYVICGLLIAALILLLRRREAFGRDVLAWIVLSILATILSELAFTFYVDVYDLSNLVGHFFKILAFFLLYKAIIETGLQRPYDLLFRNLKATERALRLERDRIQKYLEIAGVIIVVVDREGVVTFVNKKGRELLGYEAREITGRNWFDTFLPEGIRSAAGERFRGWLKGDVGEDEAHDHVVITQNGEERTITWHSVPIRDEEGRIAGGIISGEDITERKRDEETIRNLAYHDGLTGLPNRALFQDRVNLALARARRDRLGLAVMVLDLDEFKAVNDTLGHQAGDLLLRAVGKRLSGLLREVDTVARMGGDEFVILLSSLQKREDASLVARKIVETFQKPVDLGGRPVSVTTSVGIALFPQDGEDIDTLIRHADAAMYRVKEGGRNGYCHFSAPRAGAGG